VLLEGTKVVGVESNGKTCEYLVAANSHGEALLPQKSLC
jgi:hypothetical protein